MICHLVSLYDFIIFLHSLKTQYLNNSRLIELLSDIYYVLSTDLTWELVTSLSRSVYQVTFGL